ncbi:MAG: hypothetical protein ACRC6V_07950 [Bacteroidales bacterium]
MLSAIFSIVGFFMALCVLLAPIAFVIERWSIYSHQKQMEKFHANRRK